MGEDSAPHLRVCNDVTPPPAEPYVVGILGGTGPLGRGMARRLASNGYVVHLGSRDEGRAEEVARKLVDRVPPDHGGSLVGMANSRVADSSGLVLVAAAWEGCLDMLAPLADVLAGKIVISCVNRLGFDEVGVYGPAGSAISAAEHIASLLADSQVVGAFNHLSAARLLNPALGVAGEDVLVCGDSTEAKVVVQRLAAAVTGRMGIDAGPLRLTRWIEPFTAVLISVNRRNSALCGIGLTNVPAVHPAGGAGFPARVGAQPKRSLAVMGPVTESWPVSRATVPPRGEGAIGAREG